MSHRSDRQARADGFRLGFHGDRARRHRCHFEIERAGIIGLPIPGCEVKMIPNAGKLELRIRGPNITPGYLKRDDLTEKAFDEEGYYCIGDAGKLADPKIRRAASSSMAASPRISS